MKNRDPQPGFKELVIWAIIVVLMCLAAWQLR